MINDLNRLTLSNTCPNLTFTSQSCLRELQLSPVNFGCQYKCTVETLKENYQLVLMSSVTLNIGLLF